jgi:hypothetical protein
MDLFAEQSLFRIRDILVPVWIRIRGSVLLTKVPDGPKTFTFYILFISMQQQNLRDFCDSP